MRQQPGEKKGDQIYHLNISGSAAVLVRMAAGASEQNSTRKHNPAGGGGIVGNGFMNNENQVERCRQAENCIFFSHFFLQPWWNIHITPVSVSWKLVRCCCLDYVIDLWPTS